MGRIRPKTERITLGNHYVMFKTGEKSALISYEIDDFRFGMKCLTEFPERSGNTTAFEATFYVNGRKVGALKNTGEAVCFTDIRWDNLKVRNDVYAYFRTHKDKSLDVIMNKLVEINLDLKHSLANGGSLGQFVLCNERLFRQ